MVATFGEWLAGRSNKIGNGPKSVTIDLANGSKVTINGHEQIDNIVKVEGIQLRAISKESPIDTQLIEWSNNSALRKQTVEKLLEHFVANSKKSSQQSNSLKVKSQLRTSVLKNILTRSKSCNNGGVSEAKFRIFIASTHGSLVTIANQLAQHLLSGVPICLATNADSSILAAYLLDLLKGFGMPGSVIEHIIGFNVNQQGQTLTFVLFEDADVDAALDSALDAFIEYGWSSIKLFIQEPLKSQAKTVFDQKLKTEYTLQDLIVEEELFATKQSADLQVDTDAVDFETIRNGIDCFYFRSLPECLKMVNFLKGPLATSLVSLWSENAALALKFIQSINVTPKKLINYHVSESLFQCSGIRGDLIKSDTESFQKLSLANYSGSSKAWQKLSAEGRFKVVNEALKKVDFGDKTTQSAILAGLKRTMKLLPDDGNNCDNQLRIVEQCSVGVVSMDVNEELDKNITFVTFMANSLIFGNTVLLNGKLGDRLSSLAANLKSIGHDLVFSTKEPVNCSGNKVFLVRDSVSGVHNIAGVHVGAVGNCVRIIKRIQHSITVSLPEFDMAKIVE